MKTLEYHHQRTWYGRLWDSLQNAIAVDVDSIKTIAFCVDKEGFYMPGTKSLFYNGEFIRFVWPPGLHIQLKFVRDYRSQLSIGTKAPNGRFALSFRPWQSQASAAAGTHGPNYGQAVGWQRGTA